MMSSKLWTSVYLSGTRVVEMGEWTDQHVGDEEDGDLGQGAVTESHRFVVFPYGEDIRVGYPLSPHAQAIPCSTTIRFNFLVHHPPTYLSIPSSNV